jgi:hypothetical protein
MSAAGLYYIYGVNRINRCPNLVAFLESSSACTWRPARRAAPHHTPHFHAYHQANVAVFGIDPIELIAGDLPRKQRRFVEAWAEVHQAELIADWERLQAGELPEPIEPLR